MPEFSSEVLETLRQPLEDNMIHISRVNGMSEFPAQFILLATMNPCACGYFNVPEATKTCSCSFQSITRYQKKISGPLLDRIDLYVDVSPVKFNKLKSKIQEESSAVIKKRVEQAKDIQIQRFKNSRITSNAEMENQEIKKYCQIPKEAEDLLGLAVSQMNLSARGYHRVLKTARTIADIDGEKDILVDHISEALQYRKKE